MRIGEIESQLRGGGITPFRHDFEAAQHDFLKPQWNIGIQRARRHGITPDAAFQAFERFGIAEGAHTCRKEIHQHTECKNITARFHPNAHDLFGCHIGRCAIGQAEFFLQQIWQFLMAR